MNIIEKNFYLKYFYFVDTELLAEKVTAKLIQNNFSEYDDVFHVIFSEILNICKPYLNFIDSDNSFNRSDKCNTDAALLFPLSDVLKNHCILHGFLTSIKESSKNVVKISGANDSKLRLGYFNTQNIKTKSSPDADNTDKINIIYQKYTEYKNRFNKNSDSYSYYYLKKHHTGSDGKFITVPDYDGNWGCFIYTESGVHTLDKNISHQSNAIIKNYGRLLNDSAQWCIINDLPSEDKILFDYTMEKIYGFQFFTYASGLIHKIYTTTYNSAKITLKDLESSVLLELIQQTAQLPIIYNRSIFLEYAIYSILKSKYLKSHEFKNKESSAFSYISRVPATKELLIISGLEYTRKYLQKLKYVAIPLLEDIWNVLIDKLNKGNNNWNINVDTYRAYVNKNYATMTKSCSYFLKPEETLLSFSEDSPHRTDFSGSKSSLHQDFTFQDILKSQFERDSFKHLLLGYFKTERFSLQQPSLYHWLMPYSDICQIPAKHAVELNFYKNHFKNILSLAENIMPSVNN